MNQEEMKIKDIIKILKKRIKSIIGLSIIIGILSGILNFFIAIPMYKSSVRIFIGMNNEINRQYSINDLKTYKEFIGTYVEIIKTNDLVDKAIEELNIDRTTKEVLKNLDAVDVANTQIVEITYKDTDPYIVRMVLSSVAKEFVNKSKELIPGGNAELIERIDIPDEPFFPKKGLNICISIILGLVLGCLLAINFEKLEEKHETIEQIELNSKLKVIGIIPKYKGFKGVF